MCPSAETRSPMRTERTASPTAATVPMNSCPTTIGGRIRACAQESQRINVEVGPAHAGLLDANQDVGRPNLRNRYVFQGETGLGARL